MTTFEKSRFVKLPALVDDICLSVHALRLYLHVVRRAGWDGGICYESSNHLRYACGASSHAMSPATVTKAKRELTEAGLITIQKRKKWDGSGQVRDFLRPADVWAQTRQETVKAKKSDFILLPILIDDLHLSVHALRLYLHVVRRAGWGSDGVCWESKDKLAYFCGMPPTTVLKAKRELTEAGLITIQKQKKRDGSGHVRDFLRPVDVWAHNKASYPVKRETSHGSHRVLTWVTQSINMGHTEYSKKIPVRRSSEEDPVKIKAAIFEKTKIAAPMIKNEINNVSGEINGDLNFTAINPNLTAEKEINNEINHVSNEINNEINCDFNFDAINQDLRVLDDDCPLRVLDDDYPRVLDDESPPEGPPRAAAGSVRLAPAEILENFSTSALQPQPTQKESSPMERRTDAQLKGDLVDAMLAYQDPPAQIAGDYPPDVQAVIEAFCTFWKRRPPKLKTSGYTYWIRGARQFLIACGSADVMVVMQAIYDRWQQARVDGHPWDVLTPNSLVNYAGLVADELLQPRTSASVERTGRVDPWGMAL